MYVSLSLYIYIYIYTHNVYYNQGRTAISPRRGRGADCCPTCMLVSSRDVDVKMTLFVYDIPRNFDPDFIVR